MTGREGKGSIKYAISGYYNLDISKDVRFKTTNGMNPDPWYKKTVAIKDV